MGFMSKVEEKLLDAHLQAEPCRTTKEVIDYIASEFDEHYSTSGVNAVLKRMGSMKI